MAMLHEKKSNSLQGHLSARQLELSDGVWKWFHTRENMHGDHIEVAELMVGQLQVDGNYDERKLKERVKYEVHFVVELKEQFIMRGPVNLKLILSDGTVQERREDLNPKPRNKWIGVKVGEFAAKPRGGNGDMNFTMTDTSLIPMTGIVVIGAVISAKV